MRCLILVAVVSVAPMDLLCQEARADPAAFSHGYERVTRLVKREKWKAALNLLNRLLVQRLMDNGLKRPGDGRVKLTHPPGFVK